MKNCFYIVKGKNGATYVLNVGNRNSINSSVKYYKAKTVLSKLKKLVLKVHLNLLAELKAKSLSKPNLLRLLLSDLKIREIINSHFFLQQLSR